MKQEKPTLKPIYAALNLYMNICISIYFLTLGVCVAQKRGATQTYLFKRNWASWWEEEAGKKTGKHGPRARIHLTNQPLRKDASHKLFEDKAAHGHASIYGEDPCHKFALRVDISI